MLHHIEYNKLNNRWLYCIVCVICNKFLYYL